MCARLVALLMPCLLGGGALADEHPFAPLVRWAHEQAASAGAPPNPNLPSTNFSEGCLASLDELVGVHPHGREAATAPGQGLPSQLTSGYTLLFAEATAKYAFSGGMLNFDLGRFDQGDYTTCTSIPRPEASFSMAHIQMPKKLPPPPPPYISQACKNATEKACPDKRDPEKPAACLLCVALHAKALANSSCQGSSGSELAAVFCGTGPDETLADTRPPKAELRLATGLTIDLTKPYGGAVPPSFTVGSVLTPTARAPFFFCTAIAGLYQNVIGRPIEVAERAGKPDDQGGAIGICLPSTCSKKDVKTFAVLWLELVLKVQCICNKPLTHEDCSCPTVDWVEYDINDDYSVVYFGTYLFIVICAALLALCVVATLVGELHRNRDAAVGRSIQGARPELQKSLISESSPQRTEKSLGLRTLLAFDVLHNYGRLSTPVRAAKEMQVLNGMRVVSIMWVILGHTALYIGGVQPPGINMLYVREIVMPQWSTCLISGAPLAVDTFFLMSGFLAANAMCDHCIKKGTPTLLAGKWKSLNVNENALLWVPFAYVHRYIRLTPLYAFVLLYYMRMLPFLSSGPDWHSYQGMQIAKDTSCNQYWWLNLLYLNMVAPSATGGPEAWNGATHEIVHADTPLPGGCFDAIIGEGGCGEMCMGWTWYLGNDMIFFWLCPLFVLAWRFNAAFGSVLVTAVTVASTWYIGWANNEWDCRTCQNSQQCDAHGQHCVPVPSPPHPMIEHGPWRENPSPGYDCQQGLYFKPWARISPYTIGIGLAFLCTTLRARRRDQRQKTGEADDGRVPPLPNFGKWPVLPILAWIGCFIVLYESAFYQYNMYSLASLGYANQLPSGNYCGMSATEDWIYKTFFRQAWSLGLCLLIYLCLAGQGGPITWLLGNDKWTPFARLTYGVYLIHLTIIPIFANHAYGPWQKPAWSGKWVAMAHITITFFSFVASFITYLLVEKPTMNLEALFLRA